MSNIVHFAVRFCVFTFQLLKNRIEQNKCYFKLLQIKSCPLSKITYTNEINNQL